MRRYTTILRSACVVLASSLLTISVDAHHSASMFDQQQSLTLTGTVRLVQWTNPHCWVQLLTATESDPVEWSIEMGSPSQLFNVGWRPHTLKAGDKLIVVIHPMRDGTRGGLFISATDGSGQPLIPSSRPIDRAS